MDTAAVAAVTFLPLVQQNHEPEVADPLLQKLAAGDQLEALHLAPVGRVPEHVDKQQLGHVPMPQLIVLILEGCAYRGALLVDARALVGLRLAGPHVADELPQPDGHVSCSAAARGCSGHSARGVGWALCVQSAAEVRKRNTLEYY